MNVLVLNAGSSSLKFCLSEVGAGGGPVWELTRGIVERIGVEAAARDHGAAVRQLPGRLQATLGARRIDAVGHRVVHGGDRFIRPTPIDDKVLAAFEALEELAPLHNAPAVRAFMAADARG
jgi:acetate kinase